MKKILFIALVSLVVLSACKKYNEFKNDVAEDLYMRGRVFMEDTLYGEGTKALANAKVHISFSDDPLRVLYSVITDSAGYFLAQNLNSASYQVVAEATQPASGMKYSGSTLVNLGTSRSDISITIRPANTGQNGIIYTLRDANGGAIHGATVCVFGSGVLAATEDCSGSTYQFTSNESGKAVRLNVTAGTYYTLATRQVGSTILKGKDTIVVNSQGFASKVMVLQ